MIKKSFKNILYFYDAVSKLSKISLTNFDNTILRLRSKLCPISSILSKIYVIEERQCRAGSCRAVSFQVPCVTVKGASLRFARNHQM